MATIKTTFGSGGAGVTPGGASGSPNLATVLRDIADDLTALRGSVVAITAKLDLDAGVTDTNYAATTNPAALKTIKG
jgi:hypothetical protein